MSKNTFYDPLNYCFLFIDVTRKPWKSFKLFLVKSKGFYVLTTIRIVSINELMELKTKEEHRTAGENAERIYVTDLLQSEPTPLTLSMPPFAPAPPPCLPPSPFSTAINHSAHSLGQCRGQTAHRAWRRRKEPEKRQDEKEGRAWGPCTLIPKCNTPISMLIFPVTEEMDVCDLLADVVHT